VREVVTSSEPDFTSGILLGISPEAASLLAGLSPAGYDACARLIEEFVLVALHCLREGEAAGLDKESVDSLMEFLFGKVLLVRVIGTRAALHIGRQRSFPLFLITDIVIVA
jgi:hypothetical protein